MSVFKRLSNVARGKIKEIGKNLGDIDPFGGELDPPSPPPRRSESAAPEATARPTEDKRAILAQLRDEGLLTPEEYQEKLDSLAPEESEEPSVRRPMKRTL